MATWRPSDSYRDGLDAAFQRLKAAHHDLATSDGRAFQVVIEWITWTILVDQQLWNIGGLQYEQGRESFPAGKAIMGVRHANNLVKHHGMRLDNLVELVGGMRFPAVFPMVFREITWVAFNQLPTVPKKHHHPDQENAHKTWLSGQPVRDMASGITSFLLDAAVRL